MDNPPRLDAQAMRRMRGRQLTRLTPAQKLDIEPGRARARRRREPGLEEPDGD